MYGHSMKLIHISEVYFQLSENKEKIMNILYCPCFCHTFIFYLSRVFNVAQQKRKRMFKDSLVNS